MENKRINVICQKLTAELLTYDDKGAYDGYGFINSQTSPVSVLLFSVCVFLERSTDRILKEKGS